MYPHNEEQNPSNDRLCLSHQVDLTSHQPMLRSVVRRLLPAGEHDDLVQEVLLRALAGDGLPCDPGRLQALLRVIARNVCIDWLRRRQSAPTKVSLADADLAVSDRGLRDWMAGSDACTLLDDLDGDLRWALIARFRDDEPYQAIAARLGTTPGAIAVRVHRARKRLRRPASKRRADDRRRCRNAE